jgi:hypothetical protein
MKRLAILSLLTSGLATAWAQSPEAVQRYRDLRRQIFCCLDTDPKTFSFPPKHEIEEAVTEMHGLVNQTILQHLTREGSSSASISAAMAALQGDALNRYWEKPPFADLSNLNGTRTLVTAFVVLSGGEGIPDVRAYIQFYSRATGVWKMHAEVGDDFRGTDLFAAPIESPIPSEIWYLAWGKTIGDTGARLKLRLYGFDGSSVRAISRRDDLQAGTVKLSKGLVVLEYSEPAPYGRAAPEGRITEVLRPTANGLER